MSQKGHCGFSPTEILQILSKVNISKAKKLKNVVDYDYKFRLSIQYLIHSSFTVRKNTVIGSRNCLMAFLAVSFNRYVLLFARYRLF